ncbi:hypothetical protein JL721_10321 [Aureococcus anophagefferens]|nr:hypothetical protein JL721_10321 [Aureococcus anophagefferens]
MMKKQPSKRVTKAWSSLPRQSMAGNKKALSRDAEHKMRALTRRVENYKRRETTLQREVAEAETLVKAERERGGDGNPVDLASEATQWMDALGKMLGAGREHPNFNSRGEIDVAYENARGRTDDILDEQQKDMLRAFRARLFDRQQELAALRARRDEKAASWIGRVRQLESDNDYAKETTCTLQRNSSTLMARNRELRRKNGEGGKARKALVDQLVLAKRCRATLREELQQLEEDLATASQPRLARARAPPPTYVNEPVRGAAAAKRLRDELAATRKALGEWRERHGACTRLSADLQHLLWTFCQRVRGTIDAETKGALERPRPSTANLQRPSTAPTKAPPRAKSAGLGARGPPAKVKTHDLDLQLRVVHQLAKLAFPNRRTSSRRSAARPRRAGARRAAPGRERRGARGEAPRVRRAAREPPRRLRAASAAGASARPARARRARPARRRRGRDAGT